MKRIAAAVAASALAAWGVDPPAPSSSRSYWLRAEPRDAAESALRSTLENAAFAGPGAAVDSLLRAAGQQPGRLASGLSHLAAGLLLLDLGRPADASPELRHPDVALTALADHAQFALGRALEATGDGAGAAAAYLAAADALPESPLVCPCLLRAADALADQRRSAEAIAALERAELACPGQQPRVLLRQAEILDAAGDLEAAAAAYDRLDTQHPASPHALGAGRRLASLAARLPRPKPEERVARERARALALFEAGLHKQAAEALRSVLARDPKGATADLLRARLGRSLLALKRRREGLLALKSVAPASVAVAEAAFHLARAERDDGARVAMYEDTARLFPGTEWAEEALLALANHFQKDARDADALPYYRRLWSGYSNGRYADRSAWRVGWGDFRAGRYEDAANVLERAARLRPVTAFTPGYLYWAGRARLELGQGERGRQLLHEAVQRFKYAYHGLRAAETLAAMRPPALPAAGPSVVAAALSPEDDVPEPHLTRVRQLLLIQRDPEALAELRRLPAAPGVQATIAWLEWRSGRLRPAINAMKRALPGHLGAAGDQLPGEVWRILYPLDFGDEIRRTAAQEGVDPALVAALICQESTFDSGAVSPAGARGLMQVMPPTGRVLARSLGLTLRKSTLHDPDVSVGLGTRYLREMLDRFGGRVERALAAYNAGPHRVESWTAGRPDVSAEEFVEGIPFTETRNYVMTILAARETYRRLYGLGPPSTSAADASAPAGARRP